MGLRFRRSVKIGPFRLTATKSGLSGSFGVPGARVSVNSTGQVRRTVGIPGTGIYDTELVKPAGRSAASATDAPEAVSAVAIASSSASRDSRRWGPGTTLLFLAMAITIIAQAVALSSR